MNNQAVLLLIAVGVLLALLFVVPSSENFGSEVPYQPLGSFTASKHSDENNPIGDCAKCAAEDCGCLTTNGCQNVSPYSDLFKTGAKCGAASVQHNVSPGTLPCNPGQKVTEAGVTYTQCKSDSDCASLNTSTCAEDGNCYRCTGVGTAGSPCGQCSLSSTSDACKSCSTTLQKCVTSKGSYTECVGPDSDACKCMKTLNTATPNSCSADLVDEVCTAIAAETGVIKSCVPSDGQWSTPGTGPQGRSTLASPCCQPPSYQLQSSYKTCSSDDLGDAPTDECILNCCNFAQDQAANYDPSWYPMARCACSLWCYNSDEPHFSKYGTAVHYISGDIAEAHTSDSGDFIGAGSASGQ